jgi:hypothetical protein
MSCELTLFQNGEISINSEDMKKNLNTISTVIIKEIFDKDNDFNFYKKKI